MGDLYGYLLPKGATVDPKQLKRAPERIQQDLKTLKDDRIITQGGCKIYIPARYQDNGLAVLGEETLILGICLFVVEDRYYGVSRAPTMLRIEPANISTLKIEGEDYLEFDFPAGSTVIANANVVQDGNLLYPIYNLFIANGQVPWFFTYEDLGKLFEHSKEYTGVKLGANRVVHEMIAATISRDPEHLNRQYRHVVSSLKEVESNPPTIVKLNSVTHGATNTTAKLIGAYWEEGVTSALVSPSEQVEPIEDLLRR